MVWSQLIRVPRGLSRTQDSATVTLSKTLVFGSIPLFFGILSGCTDKGGIQTSGAPQMVAAEQAMIFPPPGGPEIMAVINYNYSNAMKQDVLLRSEGTTPGQNYLKIELFGPQRQGTTVTDGLGFEGTRASQIAREIRREFPGKRISMSQEYLQNSYGAFSYAVGNGQGSDLCLYGWQEIRSKQDMRQGLRNLGKINVRARLCQPSATVQELLSLMYNFTITGNYINPTWNPYGTPQAPDAGIGRSSNPIYPVTGTSFPMQPGSQAPSQPPTPRRVSVPANISYQPQTVVTAAPQAVATQPKVNVAIPSPLPQSPQATRQETAVKPEKSVVIPSPGCLSANGSTQGCR